METRLMKLYDLLLAEFGPQHWWPADTVTEMMVGAVLTQAVSWRNVEKAIDNLHCQGALSFEVIDGMSQESLSHLVKPTGYYNAKARKLKELARFVIRQHGNDLDSLLSTPLEELRRQLLGVWGIGPETADCIILYGAKQPSFVIDAYTLRIFSRLGLESLGTDYQSLRQRLMEILPPDPDLYQDFHALLVSLGKNFCRKSVPLCRQCPLGNICKTGCHQ